MRQSLTVLSGAFICAVLFAVPSTADPAPSQPKMDSDTLCAAAYAHAESAARDYGLASDGFEQSKMVAEKVHMAGNPGEDWQRYTLSVTEAAITIRNGLSSRAITSEAFVSTVTNCNARYQAITSSPSQP